MGRVGGRVRKTETAPGRAPGRAGRPGRASQVEALLELLGGTASVEQLAGRLGVRPATITKWREEAVPHVRRLLLVEREAPRVVGIAGATKRDARGASELRITKLEAMRVFLLEEYVRVSKPGPTQVAALSRQTPYGRAPVAAVCKVFGVGRTAYYEAVSKKQGKSGGQWGARGDG